MYIIYIVLQIFKIKLILIFSFSFWVVSTKIRHFWLFQKAINDAAYSLHYDVRFELCESVALTGKDMSVHNSNQITGTIIKVMCSHI